jgi:chromosome partitioning protein
VVGGVSDVDEARTVYLIPSDMQLTLFEREVSKESLHARPAHQHRRAARPRAQRVRHRPDRLPAGLSVLTEIAGCARPISISRPPSPTTFHLRLEVFRRFKGSTRDGLCREPRRDHQHEGPHSPVDGDYHRWLAGNPDNRCIKQAIPRTSAMQHAAQLSSVERSYSAKYPGEIRRRIKAVCAEVIERVGGRQCARPRLARSRRATRSSQAS